MWTMSSCLLSPPPIHSPPHAVRHRRRLVPPVTISKPSKSRFPGHLCRCSRPRMSSSSSSSDDPLTSLGRLLWGRSLPPGALVSAVRFSWSTAWGLMMRQLAPSTSAGSYARPAGRFPSVPVRYLDKPAAFRLHLYAALPCPWAHRALIVRALRGLGDFIPVSIAAPGADGSWEFPASGSGAGSLTPGPDRANGRRTLRDVYRMIKGGYDGRSTVPMLWDAEAKEVVCNESYGIIEFLNSANFGDQKGPGINLCPPELKEEIEKWNRIIYPNVNNGVYRCGFAQSQEAYDSAANELFNTLDMIEAKLATSRYLCGDTLTLADVCLFTTLIRFDLVYNVLFKCTKKKLVEYPNLHGYTCDIYQIQEVAGTCDFEAIMDGYYCTLFPLNPGGIRPVVPSASDHDFLSKPHNREALSLKGNPRIHVSQPQ